MRTITPGIEPSFNEAMPAVSDLLGKARARKLSVRGGAAPTSEVKLVESWLAGGVADKAEGRTIGCPFR